MADKLRAGIQRYLDTHPEETLNSVSVRAGLNRNSLQQIMARVSRNPRVDTLRSIAHAIRVHPSLLIDD